MYMCIHGAPNPKKIDMAAHIQPMDIPDPPVLRSEFDSLMGYVERSLTDHGRRVRASEIARERNERKVDRMDADYHNQMTYVCEQYEELMNDMKSMKTIIKQLCDRMDECKCTSCGKTVPPETVKDWLSDFVVQRDGAYSRDVRSTQKKPPGIPEKLTDNGTPKEPKKRSKGIYASLVKQILNEGSAGSIRKSSYLQPLRPSNPLNPGHAATLSAPSVWDQPPLPSASSAQPFRFSAVTSTSIARSQEGEKDRDQRIGRTRGQLTMAVPPVAVASESESEDESESEYESESDSEWPPIKDGASRHAAARSRCTADSGKLQGINQMCGSVRNHSTNEAARPKHIQNGELKTHAMQNVSSKSKEEENVGRSTYAETETRDGGTLVDDGKRKRYIPPLRAAPVTEDIFVQGLAASIYENRGEMTDAIDAYCKGRGINTAYIKVFYRDSDPEIANCKITVAEDDLESVLEPTFWPENVSVREWEHR